MRRLVCTRGRNCSPSRAHPRRWLSRRVSSWTQLVCGCAFQAVGGNFSAQIQKFGGLGEGWDGALVMRQPTTTFGRISSCVPVLCARAVRTWNLVHYFLCPCFWQLGSGRLGIAEEYGNCFFLEMSISVGAMLGTTVDTCSSASVLWWLWKNVHIFYVVADSFPEALLLRSV